MFIIPINVIASQTQTTPERVDATVFCSPCVLPPAAKKQAHATMPAGTARLAIARSEEHTSELQSQSNLVCRLLLEKKKNQEPEIDAAAPHINQPEYTRTFYATTAIGAS